MANRADRIVDPRLDIPLIDGYIYEDAAPKIPAPGDLFDGGDGIIVELPEPPPAQPAGLRPPSSINVVGFVTRTGADGRTVVDAIIDVQDVAGATGYDVREAS